MSYPCLTPCPVPNLKSLPPRALAKTICICKSTEKGVANSVGFSGPLKSKQSISKRTSRQFLQGLVTSTLAQGSRQKLPPNPLKAEGSLPCQELVGGNEAASLWPSRMNACGRFSKYSPDASKRSRRLRAANGSMYHEGASLNSPHAGASPCPSRSTVYPSGHQVSLVVYDVAVALGQF